MEINILKMILWNKKVDREKKGDENIVEKDGETGNIRERKKDPRGEKQKLAVKESQGKQGAPERVKEKIHDTFK